MKSTPNATPTKPGQKRDKEIRDFDDEVWDRIYKLYDKAMKDFEILEDPFKDDRGSRDSRPIAIPKKVRITKSKAGQLTKESDFDASVERRLLKGVIRIDDRQIGNVLPLRTPEFTWGTGSLRQLPSLQGNLDGSCETAWLLMNSYWTFP